MGTHPIDAIFTNGVAVSKAAIRAFMRRLAYNFDDFATARTYDLDNTAIIAIAGFIFAYDNADFVTADNGTTCMVDAGGRRFKKQTVSVAGKTIFSQVTIAGGSTATHYKITTDGVPVLSATPILLLTTLDLNNLGGACDLQLDAQAAISIKRYDNTDPTADEILGGAEILWIITSTKAVIAFNGANA